MGVTRTHYLMRIVKERERERETAEKENFSRQNFMRRQKRIESKAHRQELVSEILSAESLS